MPRFLLKHGSRELKPFLMAFKVEGTGLNVSFSDEGKAMVFYSRGAAVEVAKALRHSYGNYYPVEVGDVST